MKKVKYQVQSWSGYISNPELAEKECICKTLTPLAALLTMEKIAMNQLKKTIATSCKASICRTSDSRYPDAWGMANNGILITNEDEHTFVQFEVVEV